jgi:putative hydrolase of the HAD superfamily
MTAAVIFDLFETLVTESSLAVARAAAAGERLGIPREAFRAAWKVRRPDIVAGRISLADALGAISETTLGRADSLEIQRICDDRAAQKAAILADARDDVTAMLEALDARGVAIGVVSNCFEEDVRAWPSCPLARYVDTALFSFEERLAKPDPAIYDRALTRLGVGAPAAIFVGDGGDDELGGAARAGLRAFRAVWFTPNPSRGSGGIAAVPAPGDLPALVACGYTPAGEVNHERRCVL